MDSILVVNAGSSSVKFQVFRIDASGEPERLLKGQVDGIGGRAHLRATGADGVVLVDRACSDGTIADVPAALDEVDSWIGGYRRFSIAAVGHRVVHGGPDYAEPVRVDEAVLARLESYVPLAPLHQPNNLAPIRRFLERRPDLPQIACFDTAFHRGHDAVVDHYAIPEQFYREGVRRYGFHGLSYEYIAGRMKQIAPDVADGRMIVAHLGNGASMCAVRAGKSIESTMGFTALDGLPMGTRPGQIDPGVLLYLLGEKGLSPGALEDLLYRESGLKGLSGISNDMRELEASDDPRAAFAVAYFVYRAALHTGLLAAALGGLDAFVFTAGIGENSARIREAISARLGWLGATLDPAANAAGRVLISGPKSRVGLYVVPTDEELVIARHTVALLRAS